MTDSSSDPGRPRVILMTGAGSGLGRAVAGTLAARGHTVLAGCQIRPQVTDLRRDNEGLAGDLRPFRLDLTRPDDIEQAVDLAQHHGVEVLFNNAGIIEAGPVHLIPMPLIREVFETNVFGTLALTQGVVRRAMLDRRAQGLHGSKGRVVFMSSVAGLVPVEEVGAYAASKRAIEGIAETMAAELGSRAIDVAVINPVLLDTGFDREALEADWLRQGAFEVDPATAAEDPHLAGAVGPAEVVDDIAGIVTGDVDGYRHVLPAGHAWRVKDQQAAAWLARDQRL